MYLVVIMLITKTENDNVPRYNYQDYLDILQRYRVLSVQDYVLAARWDDKLKETRETVMYYCKRRSAKVY